MLDERLRETRIHSSETKFLVTPQVGAAIADWARAHLAADAHGGGVCGDEYHINTIYFDSPELHVFHRRGSFGRCKYRIRRYGRGDQVFLERKLRRPGLLAKRRTVVPVGALSHMDDATPGWEGDWFRQRLLLRRLGPVCEVGYHRLARTGLAASGPVRLTLDQRLVVDRVSRVAFTCAPLSNGLLDEWMVLELKYRAAVPALFKQLVERFNLRPSAISKYRLAMAALSPDTLDGPRVSPSDGGVDARGTSVLTG